MSTTSTTPTPTTASALAPLDLAPFSAMLWVEPEVAVAEAPKPEPKPQVLPSAPPLKLQLLGIERMPSTIGAAGLAHDGAPHGQWRAVLYDPDADRIFMVSDGERVGIHGVTSIDAARLVLRVISPQFAAREDVLAINPLDDADTPGTGGGRGRSRAGSRGGGVP